MSGEYPGPLVHQGSIYCEHFGSLEVAMEVEDETETGMVEDTSRNEGNNQSRRHATALPSGGTDVKLSTGERAHDEPTADTADPPDVEEKGLKRKKQRRIKPNKKPWTRRKDMAGRKTPTLSRASAFVHSQPAPNNTTQFIMEDHTDLESLDARITAREAGLKSTRARDSSFSIDSDEEFSSSPEDEEYLSKEFSNTYEDVHVERLGTMSKMDLIQEYMQLEQRVDVLEKKLKSNQNTSSGTNDSGGNCGTGTDSDSEMADGEMPMEPAMAEKIRIFQEEIQKLVVENEQLVQENQRLQLSSGGLNRPSSASLSLSVDSESDSSTSSGSSSSSSSGQSHCSRRSRSSQSSVRSGNSYTHTSSKSVEEKEYSDVEMAVVEPEDKSSTFSSGLDMETEMPNEEQVVKDTPHTDSSVISSVAAH